MLRPSLVLTNTVYPCTYREHTYALAVLPLLQRFIPVHTGNTHLYPSYSCSVSVYPCAYREHRDHRIIPGTVHGLSLCIQGTLALTFPFIGWVRFIPVHTGNTVSEVINLVLESGLSLCIQGTHITNKSLLKLLRFIPVHTGNTTLRLPASNTPSVYPCAYREHKVSLPRQN